MICNANFGNSMQSATCKATRIMAQEQPWMCGAPTLTCQVNLACHRCGYWQAPSIVTSTVLRQAGKYVACLPNFLLVHILKIWFRWSCIFILVLILSCLEICKSQRSCRVITPMSTKNHEFPWISMFSCFTSNYNIESLPTNHTGLWKI